VRTFRTRKDVEDISGIAKQQTDFHHISERGLGLRVSYGGRKTYYARYRFEGRQRRATIGHHPECSLEDARRLCRAMLADIDKGVDPAAERLKRRRASRSLIFKDIAAEYIERRAKPHKKSWRQTEATLTRYFYSSWGNLSMTSIDKGMVRDALDDIVARGTPSAANQAYACLRALFSWAVDQDRLVVSPCTGLRMPAKENPRSRVLSAKEIAELWAAADIVGEPFGPIVKLLFLTGQRRTEVAGICRSELDIPEALWTLPHWRTKSSRSHMVPLGPRAIAVLHGIPNSGELLFPARGAATNSVSGFSKWKRRLDELSGVSDWVLHDIRRTVATNLARLGTSLHIIRKIQNHADAIPGVARVYNQYSYLPETRNALLLWEDELSKIVGATFSARSTGSFSPQTAIADASMGVSLCAPKF